MANSKVSSRLKFSDSDYATGAKPLGKKKGIIYSQKDKLKNTFHLILLAIVNIEVNSTEKRTILAMKKSHFFREFSHILTVSFASIILKYKEVKYTCSSCSILEHSIILKYEEVKYTCSYLELLNQSCIFFFL
uniref:Uncharacterized protein n=1 Tax=Cacopsylla melanoneura TaxID=428564 RepID=A0A8D8MAC8_9HEMI